MQYDFNFCKIISKIITIKEPKLFKKNLKWEEIKHKRGVAASEMGMQK